MKINYAVNVIGLFVQNVIAVAVRKLGHYQKGKKEMSYMCNNYNNEGEICGFEIELIEEKQVFVNNITYYKNIGFCNKCGWHDNWIELKEWLSEKEKGEALDFRLKLCGIDSFNEIKKIFSEQLEKKGWYDEAGKKTRRTY